MAKFIEVIADGYGPVTLNISEIVAISNCEVGVMIFTTGGTATKALNFYVKEKYPVFMEWFHQNI